MSSAPLQLHDGAKAHENKTVLQLLRGTLVFELCRFRFLVDNGDRIIEVSDGITFQGFTDMILRWTFFGHFCGGETRAAVRNTMASLRTANVGTILDYAAEADVDKEDERDFEVDPVELQARTFHYEGEEQCDINLDFVLESIEAARGGGGFAAVKMTALGQPKLLQHVSAVLAATRRCFRDAHQSSTHENLYLSDGLTREEFGKYVDASGINLSSEQVDHLFDSVDLDCDEKVSYDEWLNFVTPLHLSHQSVENCESLRILSADASTHLHPAEIDRFEALLRRMDRAAQAAADAGVSLLVDAEQTYLQPAIDHCTLHTMRKFNKDRAVIYNTYQGYLTDSSSRLELDLRRARREGFKFGVKTVRGAYMVQERKRAKTMEYKSPIWENKQQTHDCYDANVETVLRNLDACSLMVATHNRESVVKATRLMEELNIERDDSRVSFGQLLGMCDYVTMPLGAAGYQVCKCVPYGPVRLVIPYLLRRAVENSDMLGGATIDRLNYWEALASRFGLSLSLKP